jgi:tripartite-type tricarboxylate transporter receptor subunit TctC
MYFANMASGLPHVKGGRLRALAITGAKRSPALPDAPTMAEAGVPGYEVYEWNGIFAPAATPAPVVAKLAEAVHHALQDASVRERVASLGGEIADYGPARATEFVRAQADLWGRIVREGGIKPE